jgi:hypothetical protein
MILTYLCLCPCAPPPECRWDLWLTNVTRGMWLCTWDYLTVPVEITPFFTLAGFEEARDLWGGMTPDGRELHVASRSWGWHPRKSKISQSCNLQELNAHTGGNQAFFSQVSSWVSDPTCNLISDLSGSMQRSQLSSAWAHELQKIWENKCVFFQLLIS